MLQKILTLNNCKTVKDYAVFVADKFLTEKRVWTKPDFCLEVGTYTIKFSAGKPKNAWDALERHGILIHPKSPSSGKPLVMSYILGKPEEEVDRLLTTFGEDGFTRQVREKMPVEQIQPPKEIVKEVVKEIPVKNSEIWRENGNDRTMVVLRQINLMQEDLRHLEEQVRILFNGKE